MTFDLEAIKKLSNDIQSTIHAASLKAQKPLYQHASGRRLFLDEVLTEGVENGPVIGALSIIYSKNSFMAIDRIEKSRHSFKKKRRIILYLDSKPGQISSALLLELLKLEDGESFSKHKFVQKVDVEYFRENGQSVSSGEINEALSRMFRKTMNAYFGISGRNFVRKPFLLKMQEIGVNTGKSITYQQHKNQIDDNISGLVRNMNKSIS